MSKAKQKRGPWDTLLYEREGGWWTWETGLVVWRWRERPGFNCEVSFDDDVWKVVACFARLNDAVFFSLGWISGREAGRKE